MDTTASLYFSIAFVQQIMEEFSSEKELRVLDVKLIDVDNSASILATLASAQTETLIGHFGIVVRYSVKGKELTKKMVMKIKPHGDTITGMLAMLAQACGGELASVYEKYKAETGFQYTHLREQEIYSKLNPDFTPEIFGLYTNNETRVYIILMEYLDEVELLNSVMQPHLWEDVHIKSALTQMAKWHSKMLDTKANLDDSIWDDVPSLNYMTSLSPLWNALLTNAAIKCPELYSPARVQLMQAAINAIPSNWQRLQTLPKTLVHNDLNPRNSCFKNSEGLSFCLYDWELATFHIPQYDVAEFLCFILDKDRYELRNYYIEFYRQALSEITGCYQDKQAFIEEFYLAALDFGIHRLGMYLMAHAVSPYPFIPRVVESFFDTIKLRKE